MNRIVGTIFAGAVLMAAASCALPVSNSGQRPSEQGTAPPSSAAASSGPVQGPGATQSPTATQGPISDIMNKGRGTDSEPAGPPPEARFGHPDYYAMPGQEITFDVSASLPTGVSTARYEWDFDGDGVIDEVGPVPVAAHTFNQVFEGTAEVRITFFGGGSSTASAAVHIGRGPRDGLPAAPLNVTVVVTADAGDVSTVQISWEPSGTEPYRWGLTVDGIPAGMVEGNERTASMTDVHRGSAVEIGVVGFTAGMGMGEPASVTLPAREG